MAINRTTDMTKGSPVRLLLAFSIPLILTNIGQQLYAVIDAVIVGRGVGVEAFAALGATDWSCWMDFWIVQGLTQGFGVLAAQTFGAGNRVKFRKAITMSVVLSALLGLLLTLAFVNGAVPLLRLLQTPENIFEGAKTYLVAIYAGTLIIMAYNMAAAILRAVGDGKTPLVAMGIAGVLNIVLDLAFVLVLHWGILGAALATLSAQVFAFIYCFRVILRSPVFRMEQPDWSLDMESIGRLLRLGIPLALQSLITVSGGVIAQSVINRYGYVVVAGCAGDNKLHGLLDCSASALCAAESTYVGQNWGAGEKDRLHRGVRSGAVIGLVIAAAIMASMFLFGWQTVGLFITKNAENAAAVLEVAHEYLMVMTGFLWTAYLMQVYRGAMQGLGGSWCLMAAGVTEMIARVGCVLLLPALLGGYRGLFFMDGLAWALSGIFLAGCYYYRKSRFK